MESIAIILLQHHGIIPMKIFEIYVEFGSDI
jgi:hypothetical protein